MKIAFLTPEFPHSKTGKSGGIGTSIFNLSKALVSLGHKVSIIIYGQDTDAYFNENNIEFYKVKNIKIKALSLLLTQKKVERLLNSLYNSGKIDIIEAPDWTGFTSFINAKCPIVIRQNGSDTYFCHLDNRPVKFKNKFLERCALKNASGIISVSEFTGNLTNQLFGLNRKFEVIPNSIDVNAFTPEKTCCNKLTILYFGTIIRKKGLFELPKIFNLVNAKSREVKLVLVGKDSGDIKTGSPSTWELIKPLFSKDALEHVEYLGPIGYSKIQSLIKEAAVCVFPTFAEALPVSWLEAMAMEKAIVASNIGWANEVIEDGKEGLLVHPELHNEYADAIVRLLNDSNTRKQFGIAARQKVKLHFENELIAQKTIKFYRQLIKSKH